METDQTGFLFHQTRVNINITKAYHQDLTWVLYFTFPVEPKKDEGELKPVSETEVTYGPLLLQLRRNRFCSFSWNRFSFY